VQADCAIEVDGNSYSLAWRMIRESVQVCTSAVTQAAFVPTENRERSAIVCTKDEPDPRNC
jgi:hypothetical protein